MTEKILSSVKFGVLPKILQIRSNSSSSIPSFLACSIVANVVPVVCMVLVYRAKIVYDSGI